MIDPVALESHWIACMASAAGGGKVTRTLGGLVLANGATPATMQNCILPQQIRPDRLEQLLEIGRLILSAYGRPLALFLSPAAGDVAALAEGLSALGWRQVLEQVVLLRALDAVTPHPQPGKQGEVVVTETADRTGWAQLLTEAYEVPTPLAGPLQTAWAGLTGEARYYLAYLGGEAVGTGLSWQQGRMVGLYCGAVLPAFRRRGVERATLLKRLADAQAAGLTHAHLQTEMGSPVEHLCRNRLGFEVAYQRSLWMPSEHLRPLSPL